MFFRRKPNEPVAQEAPKEPRLDWCRYTNPDPTKNVQTVYTPPSFVVPKEARAAYDSALQQVGTVCAQALAYQPPIRSPSWISDGLGFLGYPYLSEMFERPEFRKPCEVIAREATREWVKLRYESNSQSDDEKLADEIKGTNTGEEKISQIEAELKRLDVRKITHAQILHALIFGVGHVYIDIAGLHGDTDTRIPLRVTKEGMRQGSLGGFKNIEPIWVAANVTNMGDPLRGDFYKPAEWFILQRRVHADRLISMVPYEVMDLLKPAFNFGGASLIQQLRPYVHNYLRARNSISNLLANFSKLVLKTNMSNLTEGGTPYQSGGIDPNQIAGRVSFLQQFSEGQDTIISDIEEEVSIVATPLAGLNDLQASAMEAMASIPGIPLVKLFGIQPSGLNASSEGEIRVFYDEISSFQESFIRPVLSKIIDIIQLNLWGDIDPNLSFDFAPLWQLDEEKLAVVEKLKAEIDSLNIQCGKLSPDEVRMREQSSEDSIYKKVDLKGEAPQKSYADLNANTFLPQDFVGGAHANGDPLPN